MPVVPQEHFGGGERSPLGDGVHFDGHGLLVRQSLVIEGRPVDVVFEVPAHPLKGTKEFGIEHLIG